MAEGNVISASDLFSGDPNDIFIDMGVPKYDRRLTDKILSAFNHAYSIGEEEIAQGLWEVLTQAERAGAKQNTRRKPNQALDLASCWMTFVDARNRYRALSADESANSADASEAFRVMKNAYMAWLTKLRQT